MTTCTTTTDRVAQIRKELKAAFPGYKFSVIKHDYSSMSIYILSAPYKMIEGTDEQVNTYYIDRNYEGRTRRDLKKIWDIATQGVSYRETGDYGTQPNFYVWMTIGRYDRPFEVK